MKMVVVANAMMITPPAIVMIPEVAKKREVQMPA